MHNFLSINHDYSVHSGWGAKFRRRCAVHVYKQSIRALKSLRSYS